jgi:predicted transcriptional regulator
MDLKDIKELLKCKNLTEENILDRQIKSAYAADMMSDVLKSCETGALLITGLINQQVVQVAEIMDLKGIVFINGKEPSQDVIDKAHTIKLPLLSTIMNMYEVCGILFNSGLKCSKKSEK